MNKFFTLIFLVFWLLAADWVVGQEMVLVKDVGTANNLKLLAWEQVEEKWFFMEADANNNDLWVTDGTEDGTKKLLEDNVFAFRSRSHLYMGSYQGMLYFAGTDAEHGVEVWRSDGTEEGTEFFADLAEGIEDSHPAGFVELNGYLHIWAYIKKEDGTTFSQLWRTDGTDIEMLKEISVCESTFDDYDYEFTLKEYTINQDEVLFTLGAEAGGVQFCLWKTDGTSEGTILVTETSSDGPGRLITANNNVSYFTAIAQVENIITNFLWRSDGTSSGTYPLKPGGATRVAGNQAYFFYQPDFFDDNIEIWITEGTESTTNLVKTLPLPSYGDLIGFQEKLFFAFEDEEHGMEFWVSDGSETGTTMFMDINVGEGDSNPRNSIVLGDYLYFIANYDEENFGLYQMEMVGEEIIVKQTVDFALFGMEDVRELISFGEDLFVITNNANNISQLWYFNSPLIDNIEENNLLQSIKVSPNPFERETLLSFSKHIASDFTSLKLYNTLGQQVKVNYQKALEGLLMDGTNLKAGVYYFEVMEKDEVIGKGKLMINN